MSANFSNVSKPGCFLSLSSSLPPSSMVTKITSLFRCEREAASMLRDSVRNQSLTETKKKKKAVDWRLGMRIR